MLSLIVMLLLIGLVLYVIQMFIPMDVRIKQLIYILVAVWVVVQLLGLVGFQVPYLSRLH